MDDVAFNLFELNVHNFTFGANLFQDKTTHNADL